MDPFHDQYEMLGATRAARMDAAPPTMDDAAREALVRDHHPDHRKDAARALRIGPNRGEETARELADLLEADSAMGDAPQNLATPDHAADVLVLGGGGGGATAALRAREAGADVLLATKLRLGDSNTVMAEGGIQVALGADDSPVQHFVDAMQGGHFRNDPALLRVLVEDAPFAAHWLVSLGVLFDRDGDGAFTLGHGGGTSRERLLSVKDCTGLDMMRVLKDTVRAEPGIRVLEFAPAVELLTGPDGAVTGAVLKDMDTGGHVVVRAGAVVVATGGIGRLHIQRFPTSNHYGATGDALPLCYRAGARLKDPGSFQYHPTGAVFPEPMAGLLVTEALRAGGAHLVNREGRRFVDELDVRDAVCAAILRECAEGRGIETPQGRRGVWLDTPVLDVRHGEGATRRRFPGMTRKYARHGVDIAARPVLVHPTLHYQNGGVAIGTHGETRVPGLYVAGEAAGGVHGTNRLMGNSLLDIIVFGARAGKAAAERAAGSPAGEVTLDHLARFRAEREAAGIRGGAASPMLLPDYVRRPEAGAGAARA